MSEIKIEEGYFGEGILKVSKLSGNKDSTQLFRKMLILSIIIFSSMVLFVAFINLLNLSVNSLRNMSRAIVLRKTVGAQNRSIWLMAILMDIFVLLIAILLTFTISELSIKSLNQGVISLGIKNLWIDSKIVYFVIGIIFAILFIIYTIFISISINHIVKDITRRGLHGSLTKTGKHRTRNLFMIFQLAICFLFIGATIGLNVHYNRLYQNYQNQRNINYVNQKNILKFNISGNSEIYLNSESIINRISQIADINEITK
mgnify:CR=1 FL=1